LGYRPAEYPGALVPTYAPGYPMMMALATGIARTPAAVFAVVPLLGAAAVWLTYLIGKQLDGPTTGLFGALLVASSPTLVQHVVLSMSDVPVTALWLAATLLLFRRTNATALFSGLACSAAILTRPNLAPLVLLFAIGAGVGGDGMRRVAWARVAWFVVGAIPGPLAVAWIQQSLYGSPLASGYGSVQDLYARPHFAPNLRLYATWLWETHGIFIFFPIAAPLVWLRGGSASAATRAIVAFTMIFTAALFAAYVFYLEFDNWTFTRFLLPAIPLLLLVSVWMVLASVRGAPAAGALAVIGLGLLAVSWVRRDVDLELLRTRRVERRYLDAAAYVAGHSGPDTFVLSLQHSGSLRYHAGRKTVRYDQLEPYSLDEAILAMQQMHRPPLIVLEAWEVPRFKQRFAGQRWGALDWPPAAATNTDPVIRVYDPADRDRHLENVPVVTTPIPARW
jgi:4-amino-4-deoxy-L-arabinose transferase-like glycosyltransferase